MTPASPQGWSYWRDIEFRSAGFSASLIAGFASADAARTADEVNGVETRVAILRKAALKALRSRTEALRERIRAPGLNAGAPAQDAAQLRDLQRGLRQAYRTGHNTPLLPHLSTVMAEAMIEAEDLLRAARARYEHVHVQAARRSREWAATIARQERFREAVAWQNLKALHQCVDRLLVDVVDDSAKLRQAETLVTAYAQRYSIKNDTIGFFGPEAWALFAESPGHISCALGPSFLQARHVYFEDWAIRAYAERLSADLRYRHWQTPRLAPQLRWDGARLQMPHGHAVELDERSASVVACCDGVALASDIAAALCANPFGPFEQESEVFATLEALAGSRRIVWEFQVPVGEPRPEQPLRRQLEAIDNEYLKQEALAGLDTLEQGRTALAAAAGDADAVADAVAALNSAFERVTGVAAVRAPGETYGARTIVYEDCRRNLSISLGIDARAKLQAPLDLVLSSARWYCHQLAKLARAAMHDAFDRCGGVEAVPLVRFWYLVQDLFQGQALDTSSLQQELAARWASILPYADGDRQLVFPVSRVQAAVEQNFIASDCGWRSACHQSPDILVAATDSMAARRGELSFVLGELHMGVNTLINHSACQQHPDPSSLLAALRADLGMPRALPLFSRVGSGQPVRVQVVAEPGVDREICFSHDACPLDPASAIAVGELIVERVDGELVARTHDGRFCADILDAFGESMSTLAVNQFRMFSPSPHVPRIAIGDLVVQRECWRVECRQLAGACQGGDAEAFRFMRRWKSQNRLPEQVFVKSPCEVKPFYLDFCSPALVRLLIKQVRVALDSSACADACLVFSEMLPGMNALWLQDTQGEPYTSEFRVVAVHQDDRA
ncbi:hypothetical protein KAK07_23760 [Ideonella sp. 4Y16]|uniref:Lantibiotic dehydratase N-terminal domain-containing protein n=1 Tax=Ideonella alba TaxID=2824118 RepID=A0A940YFE7_9BURK|nr:lantibiotic dehydratase [Ideonella alba]MBQ0933565.1 hypothetical protein [Ideonella alba]MBQ0946375.1 hypothetical protein [Ideonella alba]